MDYLKKYLNKIGIKDFSELNPEEKLQYNSWQEALSGKKLTDKDVAVFLISKENEIITELIGTEITAKRDSYLKMQLDLIRQIKNFLNTPELQKKMTEYTLQELLNN